MSNPTTNKVYLGAIDQGTSSSRFLLFDAADLTVVLSHQIAIHTRTPHPGWSNQCPMEILQSVEDCLEQAAIKMSHLNIPVTSVIAIGLTNQRETTIVWDAENGKALAPAIVWHDTRTSELVDVFIGKTSQKSAYAFQETSGLFISTYFSALKLCWLLKHEPAVTAAANASRLLFGTVDSWLLYHLLENTPHVTDISNASRTMLMDLKTGEWDPALISFYGLDPAMLPRQIRSNAEHFGYIKKGPFKGIPISGVLGDQHAALLGQRCLEAGQAKNTYGTGCFLLMNTGTQLIKSQHGLLSTVAFQLGHQSERLFALEGSIAMAGKIFNWLSSPDVGMVQPDESIDHVASAVNDSEGVVMIPTFSGVLAPHWRPDLTASISGLTLKSTRHHICRAAIEAICFQTRQILDCMTLDSKTRIKSLKVDGGVTHSQLTMQTQANTLNLSIVKYDMCELTAVGAAIAAGLGIGLWSSVSELPRESETLTFQPSQNNCHEADRKFKTWMRRIQHELTLDAST